ncbi:MAG: hypothetical protein AB7E96_03780 [Deferribacterales bacterium]
MKLNTLVLASVFALMGIMWGCVAAPVVVAGAAGGGAVYSVTADTVTDTFTMSKEQAFEVMIGILNSQDAKITLSSISDGKINAQIEKSLVYVSIEQFNADSIKLVINAKKHIEFLPDKDTAVRIYRLFIKETTR